MNTLAIQKGWSASRLPVISTWRKINTSMDSVFYDTQALSPGEQASLAEHDTPQGFVLIVYPRSFNQPCKEVATWQFVQEQAEGGGDTIDTLAVAGVGSSAMGTAALCRDIADYLGRPVAGIVSGLGLSDVVAEAMGGWYVFGMRNAMRDALARALNACGFQDHVRTPTTHEKIKEHFAQMGVDPELFIYGSPDSTAVLYILSTLGPKIKMLVGHSKGNLSIENALEGLSQVAQMSGTAVRSNPDVITLGAVTWFGPQFNRLHQFLGQIDTLGMINSRWDVDYVPVPGTWHSLNAALPGHMSVGQSLKTAGIPSGNGEPVGKAPSQKALQAPAQAKARAPRRQKSKAVHAQ